MNWVEKYRPKKFEEVRGQTEAIEKLKRFIGDFGRRKKSLILHGPPGVGKTTIAYVIANETNSEIFELNASDLRNRDKLKTILKPASEQSSLFNKNKIILIDEVDGISVADFGGLPELIRLIETSEWPVIMTANEIWDKKFSLLRTKSELVQLKEIDYKTIKDLLISILGKEDSFINNEDLTRMVISARGDLRAAINDLQISSKGESGSINNERNKEIDIFNALRLIFKGKANEELLSLFDSVNLSLDQIMLWIEENIPLEYSGKELERAYHWLSDADLFSGRIYRKQYWRFLVYQNIFLSYGIASAKKGARGGFTSYKKPERILKIWLNNQRTERKKSIATKFARYTHIGKKRAMSEFPTIKLILKNPEIRKELKLDFKEEEYLDKVLMQ